MKMVLFDGALANQMTQYIFARCLEISTKDEVYLDNLWFYLPHVFEVSGLPETEHHEYQLTKFPNAMPNLASDYFESSVWESIVLKAVRRGAIHAGSYLPQILNEMGKNFFMIAEPMNHLSVYHGGYVALPYYYYLPRILSCRGDIYYWGYFTNAGWYQSQKQILQHELWLPEPEGEEDQAMLKQIRETYSVGIHIRRGGHAASGHALPPEYYKAKINLVCNQYRQENLHFFVFSDEIEYCKQHASEYGLDCTKNLIYCQANRTISDNHVDMQLMQECRGLILCKSVYGLMANLLAKRSDQWCHHPHATWDLTRT